MKAKTQLKIFLVTAMAMKGSPSAILRRFLDGVKAAIKKIIVEVISSVGVTYSTALVDRIATAVMLMAAILTAVTMGATVLTCTGIVSLATGIKICVLTAIVVEVVAGVSLGVILAWNELKNG